MIYENIMKESRCFPISDNCLRNLNIMIFMELHKKTGPENLPGLLILNKTGLLQKHHLLSLNMVSRFQTVEIDTA